MFAQLFNLNRTADQVDMNKAYSPAIVAYARAQQNKQQPQQEKTETKKQGVKTITVKQKAAVYAWLADTKEERQQAVAFVALSAKECTNNKVRQIRKIDKFLAFYIDELGNWVALCVDGVRRQYYPNEV